MPSPYYYMQYIIEFAESYDKMSQLAKYRNHLRKHKGEITIQKKIFGLLSVVAAAAAPTTRPYNLLGGYDKPVYTANHSNVVKDTAGNESTM